MLEPRALAGVICLLETFFAKNQTREEDGQGGDRGRRINPRADWRELG